MKLNKIEIIGYIILGLVVVAGVVIAFIDNAYFSAYTREDGIIEYSTAIFLFMGSIISLFRFTKALRDKKFMVAITAFVFFLVLFFVAGEEISWGQRIFSVESTDFFKQKNTQGETNIHNLKIGGVKLNSLIFGKIVSFLLTIYLLVLPILYNKTLKIRKLVNYFGIPVAKYHHSIAVIIITILIFIIQSNAKWELFEFAFSLLLLLILIYPQKAISSSVVE